MTCTTLARVLAKRTTPSAHALHPLRLYFCTGRIESVEPGIDAIASNAWDMSLHVDHDVRADLEIAVLEDKPWIGNAAGIMAICADYGRRRHPPSLTSRPMAVSELRYTKGSNYPIPS